MQKINVAKAFEEVERRLLEIKAESIILQKHRDESAVESDEDVVKRERECCEAPEVKIRDDDGSLFPLIEFEEDSVSVESTMDASLFEWKDEVGGIVYTHRYELLGKGANSNVYRGTIAHLDSEEQCNVALKVIRVQLSNMVQIDRLISIMRLWRDISHPGFVKCHHISLDSMGGNIIGDIRLYVALENASKGTLGDLLNREERLSNDVIRTILLDILDTVQYLHDVAGVVHNDIKPQNILLVEDVDSGAIRYKLSDADCLHSSSHPLGGSATKRGSTLDKGNMIKRDEVYGTALYMSPESCLGIPSLSSNDIWSIGVLTYQLSTGRLPWRPLEQQVPSMILHGYRQPSPNCFGPTLDEYEQDIDQAYSDTLKDFVVMCLARSPDKRPRASDLLRHPFLSRDHS
uniref:Uncharacterized protein TCIL3000_11_7250 n=1 Tax=Trypanosoma congolense (strain IL3000) TaxID=1068625 RepID=G0V0X3_TRYCI|nr:unnamed protein product [Trypanosoma congolense IL3000]